MRLFNTMQVRGFVQFDADEPYVLDVLECRDVAMYASSGANQYADDDPPGWAPAWAVALAHAEVFDRFGPAGGKHFKWRAVWKAAHADADWQRATASLCILNTSGEDRKFLYAWVDNWLHRRYGVRCYPREMSQGAVLRKVRPPEPDTR